MNITYVDYSQAKLPADGWIVPVYCRWFALDIGVTVLLMLVQP